MEKRMNRCALVTVTLFVSLVLTPALFAHCDTMDGPLIADAKKAIEQKNVNYVLKWVQPQNEKELKQVFDQAMKVRVLNADAKALADGYFFDTLVRIHRNGEGESFTGVKPSGTPIDKKIAAADKSIAAGNLTPLSGLVAKDKMSELQKRLNRVLSLKNFDVNNVKAGREYIEAYVQFFKFAEGEEEEENHGHAHKR